MFLFIAWLSFGDGPGASITVGKYSIAKLCPQLCLFFDSVSLHSSGWPRITILCFSLRSAGVRACTTLPDFYFGFSSVG